ncbi:MAG: hypothetical protein QOF98_2390 [Streptomyces sp.]|nr:hypothetical protein [Streptomyces sp.]
MKPLTEKPHPVQPHPAKPRIRGTRPPRITLRARLTLIYGSMLLAAGVVLLGATYALFDQQLSVHVTSARDGSTTSAPATTTGPPRSENTAVTADGDVLTGAAADRWMSDQSDLLHNAATRSLISQGGIALAMDVGVAAGFGWLVAGRVLAPLHRVTETARRIAAAPAADHGLHERIALRGPDDEVKDLADAFDTMVERLDRSFDGQRRFVANASHELRTPLTVGRALIELAVSEGAASADAKRLGADLLEINTRHERLITGLLLLAGADNEIPERLPVDLADIAEHVVEQAAPEGRQAGIAVHDEAWGEAKDSAKGEAKDAMTAGDALLLEQLVRNLVENGIRHNTGPGGWVRVACRVRDDGLAEVAVSNTGPVVRAYEIPALFEPFRRLGADRLVTGRGAGLGLSIVRSVARAHGGEATARPRAGGGLVVTVVLPGCPDPALTEESRDVDVAR